MHKDIRAKNVALPKSHRSTSIVKLVSESLDNVELCEFDPHECHMLEIGNESQLVKAIRQHERNVMFKNEALLQTYPTSWLVKRFRKFCADELPAELEDLTFGMLYDDNDDNERVVDEVVLSDEDQKVSPQVRLALPTYADDKDQQKKLREEVVQIAIAAGYYFSSEQPWDYQPNNQIKRAVRVFYITFEAKYSYLDVQLADVLYHVTSMRSLQKIRKAGLTTKMQSIDFSYPDRLFLFNDAPYEDILKYGIDKASKKGDTQFCVLKILKKKIQDSQLWKDGKMKFYRDPSYSDEDSDFTQQKAVFTYSHIPRNLIEDNVLVYDVDTDKSKIAKL